MGRDLVPARAQPIQALHVNRNGKLQISPASLRYVGIRPGDRLDLTAWSERGVLTPGEGGPSVAKGKMLRLPVSEKVGALVSSGDGAVLVGPTAQAEGRVLPVKLRVHPADVLGPRFVDELRADVVIRHAIPGRSVYDWTGDALSELERMLCAEPFRADPIAALVDGDDWARWMTRNRVLGRPGRGDAERHHVLVADVLRDRQPDGSWGTVADTGYAVLNLLALGVPTDDARVRHAARWLMARPEPDARPGMWMLAEPLLGQYTSHRHGSPSADMSGAIQWVGPGRDSFYSRRDDPDEQDAFVRSASQRVIPIVQRGAGACEPRMTHVSALTAEVLMRCGYHNHARVRRYIHTAQRVGGVGGYWCGCGVLGLHDADLTPCDDAPNLDRRIGPDHDVYDQSPWCWLPDEGGVAGLANQPHQARPGKRPEIEGRGTRIGPFHWYALRGRGKGYALIGAAWQNGDCWARVNRALVQHPRCRGSLAERLAVFQASRYQDSLGRWDQAWPAGMLAFLSLYAQPAAGALVMKTVPWLREHQADDGLWHPEALPQRGRGKPTTPTAPRVATYHIVAALHTFGLLRLLRP